MTKLLKLILLILTIIAFFAITGFILYDLIWLHLALFVIIFCLHSLRFSVTQTLRLLILLLPFTITIFVFGLIFQLINLQGRTDWLMDSLIKVIYFPTSFLFSKYIIALFTYQDVLDLPLSSELKSDIIFLQVFIKKAFIIMPRFDFHIRQHPLMQTKKGLVKGFFLLCAFPLSLYIYLIDEGNIIRNIYLNRHKLLEVK